MNISSEGNKEQGRQGTMKKTNTELFHMIKETNKKILNAMYSGNNEAFKIESENFNAQYEEVLKRDLVEEYRVYCAEVA